MKTAYLCRACLVALERAVGVKFTDAPSPVCPPRRCACGATAHCLVDLDQHAAQMGKFRRFVLDAAEPWFAIRRAGATLAERGPLSELLASNKDDADLCEWMQRARLGETLHIGGGAAPRTEVRRIA